MGGIKGTLYASQVGSWTKRLLPRVLVPNITRHDVPSLAVQDPATQHWQAWTRHARRRPQTHSASKIRKLTCYPVPMQVPCAGADFPSRQQSTDGHMQVGHGTIGCDLGAASEASVLAVHQADPVEEWRRTKDMKCLRRSICHES